MLLTYVCSKMMIDSDDAEKVTSELHNTRTLEIVLAQ